MVLRSEILDVLVRYGHVSTVDVPKHLRVERTDEPLDGDGFTLAFALGLYRFHLWYGLDLDVRMVFDGDELTGWNIGGDPMEILDAMELEYLDPRLSLNTNAPGVGAGGVVNWLPQDG